MEPVANVRWDWLVNTIQFWERDGFRYVEVPWLVSKEAIEHTFKGQANPIFQGRYPVGSGEQSFLQMQMEGKLEPGKYITMTPCFREETHLSDITQPHFMKVELYVTLDITHNSAPHHKIAWFLARDAIYQMEKLIQFTKCEKNFEVLKTDEGYDAMFNGVEVGSYGIREHNGHQWLYGTGLAEPRFSTLVRKAMWVR